MDSNPRSSESAARTPPEANPTVASYNATSSLERLENKHILFYFEKRSSLALYAVVN
jgi:hypothetical protein